MFHSSAAVKTLAVGLSWLNAKVSATTVVRELTWASVSPVNKVFDCFFMIFYFISFNIKRNVYGL